MAIVKFNRSFTQAQLDAAKDSSSIEGTPVVDGTWYVAKTSPTSVFLGVASGGVTTLKLIGEKAEDKYLPLEGGTMLGDIYLNETAIKEGFIELLHFNTTTGEIDMGSGETTLNIDTPSDDVYHTKEGARFRILDTSEQLLDSTEKAQVIANLGAASKDYVDNLIAGLGPYMEIKGTEASEAAIKAKTNQKKGWVWINTSDSSEWVAIDNIGATADPSKWEKFGTSGIQGALYKGTTFNADNFIIAEAADGKSKTISNTDAANKLPVMSASQKGVAKIGQGLYLEEDSNEEENILTVKESQSVWNDDTPQSGSWKWPYVRCGEEDQGQTIYHDMYIDVDSSGVHLYGYHQQIPAATPTIGQQTGNDGYMTVTQATNLAIALGALTWEE